MHSTIAAAVHALMCMHYPPVAALGVLPTVHASTAWHALHAGQPEAGMPQCPNTGAGLLVKQPPPRMLWNTLHHA
jgi:hypothetical protein